MLKNLSYHNYDTYALKLYIYFTILIFFGYTLSLYYFYLVISFRLQLQSTIVHLGAITCHAQLTRFHLYLYRFIYYAVVACVKELNARSIRKKSKMIIFTANCND